MSVTMHAAHTCNNPDAFNVPSLSHPQQCGAVDTDFVSIAKSIHAAKNCITHAVETYQPWFVALLTSAVTVTLCGDIDLVCASPIIPAGVICTALLGYGYVSS